MHFLPLLYQFLVFFSLFGTAIIVHGVPLAPRTGSGAASPPAWVEGSYTDPKFKPAEDIFKNPITGLTLGTVLPKEGNNNAGVYPVTMTYKDPKGLEHKGEDLVVKFLTPAVAKSNAGWSEVVALTAVGDYVASGQLSKPNSQKLVPVIVMKKQPGSSLTKLDVYKNAPQDEKRNMEKEVVKLTCNEVAKIAATKHLYHDDNHWDNIMVALTPDSKIKSVNLIDYGGNLCYIVKEGTSEEVLREFCENQFRTQKILT